MLHLIWTDIQSVVQLKTQLLLKIKPLWDCVCCCTSTSTTECFTVWLYMQNPHFFACSRRCALPLAWTESNSSQLVFKCTAQNEYLTSQISRELTWIFFFHINFSRFFWLYGYSRRSVCACVSLHACVCNYKDFEWFLYYFQSYSIERMAAPILSTTEDSLRPCQHFLYDMSCHYSSRHSTTLYVVLSRKILSKVHELIVIGHIFG